MKIEYLKMSTSDKSLLISYLNSRKKGIFVFSGPSGSGKSLLLHTIIGSNDKSKKLSDEAITGMLIKEIKESDTMDNSMERVIRSLKGFEIISIEDIDLLEGKQYTLKTIAQIANTLAEETLFIFTGTDIENRVPELIDNLEFPQIIDFEKELKENESE